jgi:allantoinase
MEHLGAVAKCAPPLRPKAAQDALWEYVRSGEIDTFGSDHSPAPPSMKTDSNFFKVWGGISGVQHTLPLLITEGHVNRGLAFHQLLQFLTQNVVERFKLPANKAAIRDGADADIAIVDLTQQFMVELDALHYRHKQTAYAGRKLTGKVVRTILRGRTVFKDGKIVSKPMGRLVRT